MIFSNSDDTIVAVSTPTGHGGIGVVRISGRNALAIAGRLIRESIDFAQTKSHTIHLCTIKSSYKESFLDEVLISTFRAPTSYTGEHVIEISAHGNPHILRQIVELAITEGAREAAPGEFTMRAFLSGRIDLVQAESVADLIAAEGRAYQQAALYQLSGKLSEYIGSIRSELIEIGALFEAYTDFPEEDIPQEQDSDLCMKLDQIIDRLSRLATSYARGRVLRTGIQVPIIGPPNAGKSSLFNAILAEERAIVTATPGTTRDTIAEKIELAGVTVRFVDTAGLRAATNEIEALGVARSHREIEASDLIVAVFDINEIDAEDIASFTEQLADKNLVFALNKIDLVKTDALEAQRVRFAHLNPILISAKRLIGIDKLLARIATTIPQQVPTGGDLNILTNERHYREISKAIELIQSVRSQLGIAASFELLAFDLRQGVDCLEGILGKVTNDDLLTEIFSRFCIGK